jgi:hypothetical protein
MEDVIGIHQDFIPCVAGWLGRAPQTPPMRARGER